MGAEKEISQSEERISSGFLKWIAVIAKYLPTFYNGHVIGGITNAQFQN